MAKFITVIGWIGIVVFVLICGAIVCVIGTSVVYGTCEEASAQAQHVLLPAVRSYEKNELAKFGKIGDLDARLRSGSRASSD